jgi:trans-2,3-dihydro-3-hydroxyanthranilate isomerase
MPAFAGYLAAHDHVKQGTYSFSIDRGTVQTRKSVLAVEFVTQKDRQNQIRVGGPAVLVAEGSIIAPN